MPSKLLSGISSPSTLLTEFCTNIQKMVVIQYVSSKSMPFLAQKWPRKNEFIDLNNMKISKNCNIKSITFLIYPNKNCSKIIDTWIAIQFGRNFEFLVSNFIQRNW